MESLILKAKSTRKDAAIIAWANQVRIAAEDAGMAAKEIIEEYSTKNTLEELYDELDVIHKRDQELGEFLASGKLAGFREHPHYEEMKVAMLEQVLSLME